MKDGVVYTRVNNIRIGGIVSTHIQLIREDGNKIVVKTDSKGGQKVNVNQVFHNYDIINIITLIKIKRVSV